MMMMMILVHYPLMGGMLQLVQRRGAQKGQRTNFLSITFYMAQICKAIKQNANENCRYLLQGRISNSLCKSLHQD